MRSFRNLLTAAFLAAIFGAGAFYLNRQSSDGKLAEPGKTPAVAAATTGDPVKMPEATAKAAAEAAPGAEASQPHAAAAAGKGRKDAGGSGKPDKPDKPDKENERMHDIPVSAEHPAKGLKIPYFDNEGKLQMIFVIGVATRLDADHIDMSDMQVETFDEQGQHEMYIDLPTSILNLNTSIISTQKHVTIRRDDFILTGETMEFNTKTKQGSLGGSVRMLIYNLDNSPPKPASETPSPPQSAALSTPQAASESKAP